MSERGAKKTSKTNKGPRPYIAQNGFNGRIFDEFQEAQDNQFLALKFPFLSSGTMNIGSGRSNLYIGRWSSGRLTPQRARTLHFCDQEAQDDQKNRLKPP